jgi:hypothetical protein
MNWIYILLAFAAISLDNPRFVLVYEKIHTPSHRLVSNDFQIDIYPRYEINVISIYGRRQISLSPDEWEKIEKGQFYKLAYPITMYRGKP